MDKRINRKLATPVLSIEWHLASQTHTHAEGDSLISIYKGRVCHRLHSGQRVLGILAPSVNREKTRGAMNAKGHIV